MRAVVYDEFRAAPRVDDVPAPACPDGGVLIEVRATGVCRSDWHGWMGHDPDIELPHVPGHELAGTVHTVGAGVTGWQVGDRVTVPFVCACGTCEACRRGEQQVCTAQTQPGFTHWGSFAEVVAIENADLNLVALPETVDFTTAASLGCRFATAYRALNVHGRIWAPDPPGEEPRWVAVHGCGGVGLSAIMIAAAAGWRVVAVDVSEDALDAARQHGARVLIDSTTVPDVAAAVVEHTDGGAHLSVDALGSAETARQSIRCLRARGRHVQIGLLVADDADPALPMAAVIAGELEIYGSHGMAAHEYPEMLARIGRGELRPQHLVGRTATLAEAPLALTDMGGPGMTVITL